MSGLTPALENPWAAHRILQLRRQLSDLVLAVSGRDIYVDGISEKDFELLIARVKSLPTASGDAIRAARLSAWTRTEAG